jgi:DnaJ like chaperone protein
MIQLLLVAVLFAVFYWISKSYSRYEKSEYSPKQFRSFVLNKEALANSELGLFVALVAKVAKADGRVDELEAELVGNMFTDISTLFPDPEAAKQLLKEIFSVEKEISTNVDTVALALNTLIKNDPHKRIQMMQFMVNLAYIDGTLSKSEEAMLHRIGWYLQFSDDEFTEMLHQFGSMHQKSVKESSIDQAYALLGITQEASADEIKKAYRALVKQYHPDIIKAQGANEEYIQLSTAKVQEINGAYEMIKKSRGM